MAKSIKTKIAKTEKKKSPIDIEVSFNGNTTKLNTDSIFKVFKTINPDPVTIKTPLDISISYNGLKIVKTFHIVKFRKFLASNLLKALIAKQFNIGLGIKDNNYK